MRKLKLLGFAALLALVAAGVAVAHEGAKADTDAVTAEFSAARTQVSEKTCTGADGTYRVAHEEFTGTVTSSDARLSGNLVLRTHSYINQTSGLGTTRGHAIVRDANGKLKGKASLVAVNTKPGTLEGVLVGHVKSAGGVNGGKLVANFQAQFTSDTAVSGTVGNGNSANTAVIQRGGCESAEHAAKDEQRGEKKDEDINKNPPKAQLKIAQGEVTALSTTSLSVKVGDATVTFTLNEELAKYVGKLDLAVGNKVQVVYAVRGDKPVLLKVRKV